MSHMILCVGHRGASLKFRGTQQQLFSLMPYNRQTAQHLLIILAAITVTGLSIKHEWSISQFCWYFPTKTIMFFIRLAWVSIWGFFLFGSFLTENLPCRFLLLSCSCFPRKLLQSKQYFKAENPQSTTKQKLQ